MNKRILIASAVALALSAAGCSREEKTTADFRGTPPNAVAEQQNATPGTSSPAASGGMASEGAGTGAGGSVMGSTSSSSAAGSGSASGESGIGGASSSAGGSVPASSAADSGVGATSGAGAGGSSGTELLKAKNCMNCHDPNTKKVGPSFKDIAARKPNVDAAVTKLKEGKGHVKVAASDAEIKTMVETMLDTK
ncbi:MAG: c-type cytochrome [Burkholderiales bacterium]